MRIFLERTIAKEALESVQCNQCGQEIKKNDFGYFEDHLSVTKTWGFGTAIDGETHTFDLCFTCYTGLIGKFKFPPETKSIGIQEAETAM